MLHGGQLSFNLQLVKIPLFIIVLFSSPEDETPYILGSCSSFLKTSLCILILVSFETKLFLLKSKIPSEKK